MTVEHRIAALLSGAGVPWERLEHPFADTAIGVALARGTPLAMGGKSLVLKLDRGIGFAVLAVPGDQRLDNRRLRAHLGLRRYRFATPDELLALTGLTPGCVPPFGHPVFDVPLFVDAGLASGEEVAFSLGSHTHSARMVTADWLAAARPADVFPFAAPIA